MSVRVELAPVGAYSAWMSTGRVGPQIAIGGRPGVVPPADHQGMWFSVLLVSIVAAAAGVWPLQPEPAVVHPFDPPTQRWETGHRGVDLAGRVGMPVHAALAGTVAFVGAVGGVRVVTVDHGDTHTTYEPVSASVRRGAQVGAGQVIGTLGYLGSHCLPHACLHWGLISGSHDYRDPLTLVGCGGQPVRLLPLNQPGQRSSTCDATPSPMALIWHDVLDAVFRLEDALAGMPGAAGRW